MLKETPDLPERNGAFGEGEGAALPNLLRRAQELPECCARERRAKADPAHAEGAATAHPVACIPCDCDHRRMPVGDEVCARVPATAARWRSPAPPGDTFRPSPSPPTRCWATRSSSVEIASPDTQLGRLGNRKQLADLGDHVHHLADSRNELHQAVPVAPKLTLVWTLFGEFVVESIENRTGTLVC